MMTMKVTYAGSQTWHRVDSHWDKSSYVVGSSWGPGVQLSTNWVTNQDNNGATDLGKTYVMALGDGSGVSLLHLTLSTFLPTANTSAGSGSNILAEPEAAFTTEEPSKLQGKFCAGTTMILEGTIDTTTLSDTISAYSDGYKASTTIQMDQFFAGGVDGWRGTCLVYYSSESVEDNT